MEADNITLTCSDGYPIAGKLFASDQAHGAVVIAPALGVPGRFYVAFAAYLASQGSSTLIFDYRGSGESASGPVRGRDMRMADWGRLDIEAALDWTLRTLRPLKLFLVGHSAGAQLPGLAPASEQLDGMVMVAGSAPHLRHYPAKSWPKLMLTWYLLGPLLSWRRDGFPARQTGLGSTRVPAGVVREWCDWARSRDYLFDARHDFDTSRYRRLSMPILSCCFADDGYATPQAVDALLAHYPAAHIERRIVPKPTDGVIGHFGFFRKQHAETLWRETANWLRAQT